MGRQVYDDITFKLRSGKASEWEQKNPILENREPGLALKRGNFKVGDGRTPWNDLPWFLDVSSNEELDMTAVLNLINAHVQAPDPHPVYDDGPSLLLLYQNAKV